MKVKIVDENKIVIYLNSQEIFDIFGGYKFIDYDTAHCRTKIHGLLAAAIPSELLPFDCERVLIEVKPAINGCTISLTEIHSLKKTDENNLTITFIFESSESLISAIPALKSLAHTSGELYSYGKEYAVICTVKECCREELTHISEYGKISEKRTLAAKIREHWHKICEENAIGKMVNAFLK